MLTQEFWDARYRSAETIWSGNPNPHLVAQVADLTPGSALDVGSGEGADAIWLATRGWQVTGIDLSTVALERAARLASSKHASNHHQVLPGEVVPFHETLRVVAMCQKTSTAA